MCAHIKSVKWFLSFAMYKDIQNLSQRNWRSYVDAAAALSVDNADSEEDSLVGNKED